MSVETSTNPPAHSAASPTARYSAVAIALHWAIALLILGQIAGGLIMTNLDAGSPLRSQAYQLHKSFGITVLLLTVSRILWRVMNPPPPVSDTMKPIERAASHAVHMAFYALMILMPLSGWAYSSIAGYPTKFFGLNMPDLPFTSGLAGTSAKDLAHETHEILAFIAIGLLALHVAGAIKHELMDEEGVLKRMIPGLFGRTTDPAPPPKGFVIAFGGAGLLFVAIAFLPMALRGSGADLTEVDAAPSNWIVDMDQSEILFSGTHDGNSFTGDFAAWRADILFDPDNLEASTVTVIIDTASASTGVSDYDDYLVRPDFFHVGEYETASVMIDNFEQADGNTGYTADATLAIKDVEVTVPFTFDLTISGDAAKMTGETTLLRTPLAIGQQTDGDAEWISEEIGVAVTVVAQRQE